MAVRYKLTKINDNITDSEAVKYSVTTVSYDNVNLDVLAVQIAESSTFTYGDVKGLVKPDFSDCRSSERRQYRDDRRFGNLFRNCPTQPRSGRSVENSCRVH